MVKEHKKNIIIIIFLVFLSAITYFVQYLLFHQKENTIFYLLQDLAFVPIQVVMVTLIINRFLNEMENSKKIKKINVIISTFFVEIGIPIISTISKFNANNDILFSKISIREMSSKEYNKLIKEVKEFNFDIYAEPAKLDELYSILKNYKDSMLNLLANPNLLEHDSFTDMLWAVFHVIDELQTRGEFHKHDKDDIDHLSNDILRAYTSLIIEWISYMNYLQREYPFLFTLALKKNPFLTKEGSK